jgi:serine/threonine protein kinase
LVPKLDAAGLDLLDRMLQNNPAERITAKDALLHEFLLDVPEYVKNLK